MKSNQIGQVLLRLALGFIFFMHGLAKFQGGISYTAGYFDSLGIPEFMAYIVAFIELLGGIAMMLGIGTRIVGGLFGIIMLGAIFTAKLSGGLLGSEQMLGYELDLALLAISVYFVLARKTFISLDNKLLGKTN